MSGAINFAMSDIYGGVWGTTEQTIPEAKDQKALVDDQKAADDVSANAQKKFPVALALVLVLVLVILSGVVK